jgi:hypothetical protein
MAKEIKKEKNNITTHVLAFLAGVIITALVK